MNKFGIAIPLVYGFCGLLPFARAVTAVAGAPITPPDLGGRSPTEAEIFELQSRYIAALTDLFETHKAEYGCPSAELEIE